MNNINQMIAQGVRPVQIESPFNQLAQVEQIRSAQQANALRQAQMMDLERQREQTRTVNQLYREAYDPGTGRIDEPKLYGGLAERGFGSEILGIQEQAAKGRKVTAESKTAQLKFASDELGAILNAASSSVDQPSYNIALTNLKRLGVDVSGVPEVYDPQYVGQAARQAMDAKQRLDAELQAAGQRITLRGQDVQAGTTRRGQDIQAGTTRRGQDIQAETTRRGQDITERRERDLQLAENQAAARARGKVLAENKVEAERALPGAIATAEQTLKLIDEMIGDAKISKDGKEWKVPEGKRAPAPGFESYVGMTLVPFQRFAEGSDAASYERRQLQIEGKTFLEAFESLRGGGAITEVEGAKGQQAISRMNKAQSEVEYIKAARELQDVVRAGVERARKKAGAGGAAAPGAPAAGGGGVDMNNPLLR
jgi:hypothetical protein